MKKANVKSLLFQEDVVNVFFVMKWLKSLQHATIFIVGVDVFFVIIVVKALIQMVNAILIWNLKSIGRKHLII